MVRLLEVGGWVQGYLGKEEEVVVGGTKGSYSCVTSWV